MATEDRLSEEPLSAVVREVLNDAEKLVAQHVNLLRTDDPWASRATLKLEAKSYPYTCLFDKQRNRLYVSLWAKAKVAVVDLEQLRIVDNFATQQHPTEMLLSPDGKSLYVACANSTNTVRRVASFSSCVASRI